MSKFWKERERRECVVEKAGEYMINQITVGEYHAVNFLVQRLNELDFLIVELQAKTRLLLTFVEF